MDTFNIAREYFSNKLKKKIEMFKIVMTDFNAILDEYEIYSSGCEYIWF